jgi:hypothetical protein
MEKFYSVYGISDKKRQNSVCFCYFRIRMLYEIQGPEPDPDPVCSEEFRIRKQQRIPRNRSHFRVKFRLPQKSEKVTSVNTL